MEEKIDKLNDISFIGGGNQSLFFSLVDSVNEPISLAGSEVKWVLTEVGQKDSPLIVKDNKTLGGVVLSSEGSFKVMLAGNDTLQLETNRYEHEIIVIQQNGDILRPCYGYIDIKKGTDYSSYKK